MNILKTARTSWMLLVVVVVFFGGCQKPENSNDWPVSHWLNDNDACVRSSVGEILKSGLSYPHFSTSDDFQKNGLSDAPVKTVDVWVGQTRFVIPSQIVVSNGSYPEHHPRRYYGLHGTLPNFYPMGDSAGIKDGMTAMVEVIFGCSMKTRVWGNGPRSSSDGLKWAKARYEEDARKYGSIRQFPPKISINQRIDLGMVEVLYERGGTYKDGRPMWEATYWPLDSDMIGPDGSVSGISCTTRHDGDLARYSGQGWRCSSSMALTATSGATIQIYVSHIRQMPAVFNQIKNLLLIAQQSSKE